MAPQVEHHREGTADEAAVDGQPVAAEQHAQGIVEEAGQVLQDGEELGAEDTADGRGHGDGADPLAG